MVQMSGSSNPNGQGGGGGGDGRKPYRGSRPDLQEKIRQKYLRRVGSGASSSSSGKIGSPALSQSGGASSSRRRSQDHRPGGVSYSSTPEMAFNDPDGNGNFMFFDGSQSNQSPPCLGATGGQGHDQEDSALNTVLKEIQNNKAKKTSVLVGEEGTIYQNNFDDDDDTVETIPVVAKQRPDYRAPVVARQQSEYTLPVVPRQQSEYTLPVVARQQPIYHRSHHRAHRNHERFPIHLVRQQEDTDDGDDEATESDDTSTSRRSQGEGQGQDIDPLQRIINACRDEVNAPIDDRIYGMRPILPGRGFGRFEFPIRGEIGDGAFGINRGENFMGEPRQGERNGLFDRIADNSLDETLLRMKNDGHNAEMDATKRRNELLAQQLNENESGLRRRNNLSPLNDPNGLQRDEIPQDGGNNDVEDDIESPRARIEGPHTEFVNKLLAGIDDDNNMQPDDNLISLTLQEFGGTDEDGERSVNHMMNDFREADRLRELEGDEMRAGALGSGFGIESFPPSGEHLLGLGGYNPPKPDNVNRKANSDDQSVDQPKDDCYVAGEVEHQRRDVDLVGPSLTPGTIKGPNHKQDNGRTTASRAGIALDSASSTDRNLHASARNDTTKHVPIDRSIVHTGTRSEPYSTGGLRDRHTETDQRRPSRTDSSTGQMDSRLFQTDPTDQAAGPGQIKFGQHSTRPGQTDLWGQSVGDGMANFGQSLTGPGSANFGQSLTGPGLANFGQSSTGPGMANFGQSLTGLGTANFGQSSTGPGLANFGQSLTGPGMANFGQSSTGPGLANFGQSTTGPQYSTGASQNEYGYMHTGVGQHGGQNDYGAANESIPNAEKPDLNEMMNQMIYYEASKAESNRSPRATDALHTIIILDTSSAMDGEPFMEAGRFISQFLSDLEELQFEYNQQENVALVCTGSSTEVVQHFTNNYTLIRNATDTLITGGDSHLFLAVMLPSILLSHGSTDNRPAVGGVYNLGSHVVQPRVIFITNGRMNFRQNNTDLMTLCTDLIQSASQRTLLTAYCVPVGNNCNMPFLELLSESTGGRVVFPAEVKYLSRAILHHEIVAKLKGNNTREPTRSAIVDILKQVTGVADVEDVNSILEVYRRGEPDVIERERLAANQLQQQQGPNLSFGEENQGVAVNDPTQAFNVPSDRHSSLRQNWVEGQTFNGPLNGQRQPFLFQDASQEGLNIRGPGFNGQLGPSLVQGASQEGLNIRGPGFNGQLGPSLVQGASQEGLNIRIPGFNGQLGPSLVQGASQEGLNIRGPGFNGQLGPSSVQGASQGLNIRGPGFNGQLGPSLVQGASQEGLNISGSSFNGQSGSSIVHNGFEGANQGAQGGLTHKPIVAPRKVESIGKISTLESSQDDNIESGKFTGEIQQMLDSNSSDRIESGVSMNNDEEMDIDPYNLNERKGESENNSSSIELPEEMEGLFKDGGNRSISDICSNGMLGGLTGLFNSNVNNKNTENGIGSQINDSSSQNNQLNAQRSSMQSPLRPAGSTTGSHALLDREQKSRPEALQKEGARRQENQQGSWGGNLQASRRDNLYEGLRSDQSRTAGGDLQASREGSLLERGGNVQTHTLNDQLARKGSNQQSLSQQMSAMNIHGQHGANSRRIPINFQRTVGNSSQNISTGSENSQSERFLYHRENVSQNTVHQPASVGQGAGFRRVNPSPQNEVFGAGNVRGGGQHIRMPNDRGQRVGAEGSIMSPDVGHRTSRRILPQGHSEGARQNQRSTEGSSTHSRPAGKDNPKNLRGFP
ncbi:hypothetical protein ACF0H5_012793 [Mactra antiquata]